MGLLAQSFTKKTLNKAQSNIVYVVLLLLLVSLLLTLKLVFLEGTTLKSVKKIWKKLHYEQVLQRFEFCSHRIEDS